MELISPDCVLCIFSCASGLNQLDVYRLLSSAISMYSKDSGPRSGSIGSNDSIDEWLSHRSYNCNIIRITWIILVSSKYIANRSGWRLLAQYARIVTIIDQCIQNLKIEPEKPKTVPCNTSNFHIEERDNYPFRFWTYSTIDTSMLNPPHYNSVQISWAVSRTMG